MVKKQDSPRQLHLLREVKRKAEADQEVRLQQTLAHGYMPRRDGVWVYAYGYMPRRAQCHES
jgi:hypothetical protein